MADEPTISTHKNGYPETTHHTQSNIMTSPLAAFMANIRLDNNITDIDIVSDNARIEKAMESLNDSMHSIDSVEERKANKNKARWEHASDHSPLPAISHIRPVEKLWRSSSDPTKNRGGKPPAMPTRQSSNEDYQIALLALRRRNQTRLSPPVGARKSRAFGMPGSPRSCVGTH